MSVSSQSEPLLFDIAYAANVVGVSVSTIRHWTSDGLPFVRGGPGGKKLYSRRDLERFIERLKESAE
jgi:DNA-binding transcriptional MerR regulator